MGTRDVGVLAECLHRISYKTADTGEMAANALDGARENFSGGSFRTTPDNLQ